MYLQSRGLGSQWVAYCVLLGTSLTIALLLPMATVRAQELGGDRITRAPLEQDFLDAEMPEEDPHYRNESYLSWLVRALGIRYSFWFLLLYSLLGGWLLWCLPAAMRGMICPTHVVRQLPQFLAAGRESEARDLVNRSQSSVLGRALAAGLYHLHDGAPLPSAVVQRAADFEEIKLRNRLSYLLLLVVLVAITGATGTIDGAIASFIVIAKSSVAPKSSEIAEGISVSLITMMFGLFPAFPVCTAYCVLRNRCRRLAAEARLQAEMLLLQFAAATAKGANVRQKDG